MLQRNHLRYFAGQRPKGREYWRADALTSEIANFWSKLSFLAAVVSPITGNVSLLLRLHQQSGTLSLMRKWCVSPRGVLSNRK